MNTIENTQQREPAERDVSIHKKAETSPGESLAAKSDHFARIGRVLPKIHMPVSDDSKGAVSAVTSRTDDAPDSLRYQPNPASSRATDSGAPDPKSRRDSEMGPPETSDGTAIPGAPRGRSSSNARSTTAGDTKKFDNAFVANLDARMAKSELQELGWRDRDDLGSVMRDLERLAGAKWQQAATLWEKYRPDDPDKPIFIDGDDKGPTEPSAEPRHSVNAGAKSSRAVASRTADDWIPTKDKGEPETTVPTSLVKRYLVAENKFYFRDDPNLLAFEDKGKRLATEHDDPEVARSMVELAEAKQWTSIKVKGTDEFRREVWLAAVLRGLDVQGYEPSDVDKMKLSELQQERSARRQNTIEQGMAREKHIPPDSSPRTAKKQEPSEKDERIRDVAEPSRQLTKPQRIAVDTLRAILTERGDSAEAVEMAAGLATARFHRQRVYVGRLLAHGPAPYEHKPDEKENYFVTLKTINGEQTIWGVDLARAIEVGGAKLGDDLALTYRGKETVTVRTNERDANGRLTGKQVATEVDRNTWKVGKLDTMRSEAQERLRQAAARADRVQPEVRVYDVAPAYHQPSRPDPARSSRPDPQMSR